MKSTLILLAGFGFACSYQALAQSSSWKCDTIEGNVVNCVDENGMKQGLWQRWQYCPILENGEPDPNCGYWHFTINSEIPLEEGNYTNSQKIGTWRHQNRFGLCWGSSFETHSTSGEVNWTNECHSFDFRISADSSYASGYFLIHKSDTINIECEQKFCIASAGEILVFEDELKHLEMHIDRAVCGWYEYQIRNAKARLD